MAGAVASQAIGTRVSDGGNEQGMPGRFGQGAHGLTGPGEYASVKIYT